MSDAVCIFEGCHKPVYVQKFSLCSGHYQQQHRGQALRPLMHQDRPTKKAIETQCSTCKVIKAREDFYLRTNGTLQSECKVCMGKRNNDRQKKAREALRRLEALERA